MESVYRLGDATFGVGDYVTVSDSNGRHSDLQG